MAMPIDYHCWFEKMLYISEALPAGDIPKPNDALQFEWFYVTPQVHGRGCTEEFTARRGLLYGTNMISPNSIFDYCYRVYFGTAMYVDYLTFSHLNPITNPTPQPNATLTIGATARNPNYQGSRVYPNYQGSSMQP
jgi:hypothetical protein